MAAEIPMTGADFEEIARILHGAAGIALSAKKVGLVYARLNKRLRTLGIATFREYCRRLEADGSGEERAAMVAALTTNVTSFFRERHHFQHLRSHVLPPLVEAAREGAPIRIWSAGCSRGHEPFSIGLTLLSLMPDAAAHDVRILASDLDPNVISYGNAGAYVDDDLAAVPAALRERWFIPVEKGANAKRNVGPELRKLVRFRNLNLVGDWPLSTSFNAIFCRNVAIYFDVPTKERLWNRFCDYLAPDGWLYVGHSEHVSGLAAGRLASSGATAYQLVS
jgi:chemotaxis protein methyltransferase CheR